MRATLPSVIASVSHSGARDRACAGVGGCRRARGASAGSSTSTRTTTRSSTTSQPTAMRPFTEPSTPAVLERAQQHDRAGDREREAEHERRAQAPAPEHRGAPTPSAVATTICTIAPGMAMRRTASRSSSEKCSPTPNIISITPISASWPASATSATKPGVAGPIDDAGHEIADQRRQPKPRRGEARGPVPGPGPPRSWR